MQPSGKKYNSLDRLVQWYAVLLAVMLFAAYPLALFIPHGYGYGVFSFFLPAFLLATALSTCLVLFLKKTDHSPGRVELAFVIYCLSLLISTLVNGAAQADFLKYMGVGIIPLSVALAVQYDKHLCLKIFQWGMALLWLLNVAHSYHKLPHINIVGISGNQNWLSALILATLPGAILILKNLLSKFMRSEKSARVLALTVVLVVSAPIIIKADSRASYVALVLLPLYLFFILCGRRGKLAIMVFLAVGAFAVSILFKSQIERESRRNVRLPLWSASINMLLSNPLGVGPENFEKRFPEYALREQKQMLVAAETTIHPHNEFLNIAAAGGLVAACCWLLVVGTALFSPLGNKEEWCYIIPLFILFVQGMADKPLVQMPTMLLFYLLLGVVLGCQGSIKLSLAWPQKDKRKFYALVACVLLLCFAYFSTRVSLSSWFERQGIRAKNRRDNSAALAHFEKSSQMAPWRLFPAYKAFIITTINQPNLEKAFKFYELIQPQAPDFRQFNLLKGKFFTQLASVDKQRAQKHLQRAWQSYNRACELNVTNVLSFVDRLRFAARFMSLNELQQSYASLLDLYRYKAAAAAFEIDRELRDWGKEWLANSRYSEFLATSASFMGMMKPALAQSVYYPSDMYELVPLFYGSYQISDMVFALDSIKLGRWFERQSMALSFESIMNKVQVDESREFSWPLDTLNHKSANRLSIYTLAAMVARLKGYEPFLVTQEEGISLVLQQKDKFWLSSGRVLQEVDLQTVTEFLRGVTVKYFDYPQAFYFKNEFLSYVLAESAVTSSYCRNPDFVINNFVKRFPRGLFELTILRDPFEKIKRKMQSGR